MICQVLKISLPLVESVRLNTIFDFRLKQIVRREHNIIIIYYVCDCMDCCIYLAKQNRSTMSVFCNGKM